MMNGVYGGMSVGAWVLMSVFWVALIASIVWLVATLLPRNRQARGGNDLAERPDDILDRRFASGEIDASAYEALSTKLREARAARA